MCSENGTCLYVEDLLYRKQENIVNTQRKKGSKYFQVLRDTQSVTFNILADMSEPFGFAS